jgi:hypothetical protein
LILRSARQIIVDKSKFFSDGSCQIPVEGWGSPGTFLKVLFAGRSALEEYSISISLVSTSITGVLHSVSWPVPLNTLVLVHTGPLLLVSSGGIVKLHWILSLLPGWGELYSPPIGLLGANLLEVGINLQNALA